ncbi:hypothetical protein [Nocardioides sp. SYSU DS0651]|uniref:hypothetical protein n=1 Tax=Nocardioides sp. SYSU DS0651 TaxID=3415955 RepID=UPI003F4BE6CA
MTETNKRYIEAGGEFLRELPYGTRMWVRDREAGAGDPDEQALRLRGTAKSQRDEWLLSDDTIMSSAELADAFRVCLPGVERR